MGLGFRSGLCAANFLADKGVSVTVSDQKSEAELGDLIAKLAHNVTVEAGNQSPELLDQNFDLVVISPGVPKAIPLIKEAEAQNVPVIAEIELAYAFLKGTIIAITGTDGKSTTTSLTGHILESLNLHTVVGGNIGIPLISLVEETTEETVSVIELSSFQLETVKDFTPHVGAILNLAPDHLDRYNGMEDYFEAKKRIAMNQKSGNAFIYNCDDNAVAGGTTEVAAERFGFSITGKAEAAAWFEDGAVWIREDEESLKVLDVSTLQIPGLHNVENVMASLLMVRAILKEKNIHPN